MGFDLREVSYWLGKPVQYFRFVRGGRTWAYTSAGRDVVLDGVTYTSAAIKRSSIKVGGERRKLPITVSAQRDLAVMDNWHPFPPRDRVMLTIMTQHVGETDVAVEWVGRVIGRKVSGTKAELSCEPTMTSAQGAGLSRCWQYGCPHAVYSQGVGMCNVNKDDFAVPATLTQVNGTTFTSAAFAAVPSGRLAGGFVQYARVSDSVIEYRTIMEHSGSQIVIDAPLYDIALVKDVVAFPGCRGTEEDCTDFFDNYDNYGGDPNIPRRSPTDGNPIW